MRILVTGGAGYVGSHTVRRLLEAGHDVWVYDSLVTGHAESVPADRLIRGNLHDGALLRQVFRDRRIESVVHFAAHCYVGESVTDPAKYYRNNVGGTLELLDAMRETGARHVVFSSTCATYGIPLQVPITEDEPQKPINPYGFTKLAIERALADYSNAYGLRFAALRYFNAAGASPSGDIGEHHEPETHLIPLVLQVALGVRPQIDVYGTDYSTPDGTCIRDYIHVDDLAEAHILALEKLTTGSPLSTLDSQLFCNVGVGRGYSVREVIELARRITGRPIPVREAPRRPGDPPVLVASAERIRRELGWQPRYTTLEPILETAWHWHQQHPRGYTS